MLSFLQKFGVAAPLVAALSNSHLASAQHSDIEIGYKDGKIALEVGSEGRVFRGDFPTSDLFEQTTDDPGFATNVAEGLLVNGLDVIDYNILGPLGYHDGTSFSTVPAGANITIEDNPGGSLVVDALTVGPVTGPRFIGQANSSGNVHSHIDFALNPLSLDTPAYGAYGLLMELTTDEPGIANSDPFYIVFNFGLEAPQFDQAVGAFAARIPEPASLALAGLGAVGVGCLRNRSILRCRSVA